MSPSEGCRTNPFSSPGFSEANRAAGVPSLPSPKCPHSTTDARNGRVGTQRRRDRRTLQTRLSCQFEEHIPVNAARLVA